MDIMGQSARLVVNQIATYILALLFSHTTVDQALDSITTLT